MAWHITDFDALVLWVLQERDQKRDRSADCDDDDWMIIPAFSQSSAGRLLSSSQLLSWRRRHLPVVLYFDCLLKKATP